MQHAPVKVPGARLWGGEKNFADKVSMSALKATMSNDGKRLLESPEVVEHRQREAELSDHIAKLTDATNRAAEELYPSHAFGGATNPFKELMNGVSVNYAVDAATRSTKTIVDLNWD